MTCHQAINRDPDQNPMYQELVDTLFALNCMLLHNRYTIGFNQTGTTITLQYGKHTVMVTGDLPAVLKEIKTRYHFRKEQVNR